MGCISDQTRGDQSMPSGSEMAREKIQSAPEKLFGYYYVIARLFINFYILAYMREYTVTERKLRSLQKCKLLST
jgi:hypothetical protein